MNEYVVCVLVGGAAGGVIAGSVVYYFLSNIIYLLKDDVRRARITGDNWHKMWIKVNNHLNDVRNACKKIKVPVRGLNGKINGSETVWKIINGDK